MPDDPLLLPTLFSERQAATLRALVDRLIPADDFPGGWEAGVGDYLEGQFERDLRVGWGASSGAIEVRGVHMNVRRRGPRRTAAARP